MRAFIVALAGAILLAGASADARSRSKNDSIELPDGGVMWNVRNERGRIVDTCWRVPPARELECDSLRPKRRDGDWSDIITSTPSRRP